MYMGDPVGEDVWAPIDSAATLGLTLSAAVVLVLGVYPAPLLSLARVAANALR